MTNKFTINLSNTEIGKRVRSIIGVPDALLTDDVISSPVFKSKTEAYINKSVKEYWDLVKEEDLGLLNVSAMYYISYLLCVGMDARLPKQMENLSTKTMLQNISWDEKALELLQQAEEALGDFLEEFDIDEGNMYGTFADLSDEVEYPETTV